MLTLFYQFLFYTQPISICQRINNDKWLCTFDQPRNGLHGETCLCPIPTVNDFCYCTDPVSYYNLTTLPCDCPPCLDYSEITGIMLGYSVWLFLFLAYWILKKNE